MAYGDEFNPNNIYAFELREFAEEVGVNYKLAAKILSNMCNGMTSIT